MALYEVNHVLNLTQQQKDRLAFLITDAHVNHTGALRMFINVTFNDTSSEAHYIGGVRHSANRIVGFVRQRGEAGDVIMKDVVADIQKAWERTVGTSGTREMGTIIIVDGVREGMVKGFRLPKAYEDDEWIKKNKAAIQERALEGDQAFSDLLKGEDSARKSLVI